MQPLHTTSSDTLTHFLEEPVCALALCVIFNYQDEFVAFACHRITGPSYSPCDCDSCFCLAAGLFYLPFSWANEGGGVIS